ncbi:hypothetical protein AVEN_163857-1, partial [Araneus ventricosus]
VHYVDYGDTEEVEKKYLRKLQERFLVDESFSVQCHLDGIIPAGGSSNWSHSACDIFRQLVASHEHLLLSSKGDIVEETKSLPADLLIEKLIRGGALEPTKIEYVSLRDEIVKYGYALPTRRYNIKIISILIKGNVCVCLRCPDESLALTTMKIGSLVVIVVIEWTSKPEF